MLLYRGEFLSESLRKARVTEAEVRAAIRSAGLASLRGVEAVVLETDGSFSVVHQGTENDRHSLAGVRGPQTTGEGAEQELPPAPSPLSRGETGE